MGAVAFDPGTRARLLSLEGFMQLLVELAGRKGGKEDKVKLHAIRLLAILGEANSSQLYALCAVS